MPNIRANRTPLNRLQNRTDSLRTAVQTVEHEIRLLDHAIGCSTQEIQSCAEAIKKEEDRVSKLKTLKLILQNSLDYLRVEAATRGADE